MSINVLPLLPRRESSCRWDFSIAFAKFLSKKWLFGRTKCCLVVFIFLFSMYVGMLYYSFRSCMRINFLCLEAYKVTSSGYKYWPTIIYEFKRILMKTQRCIYLEPTGDLKENTFYSHGCRGVRGKEFLKFFDKNFIRLEKLGKGRKFRKCLKNEISDEKQIVLV